MSKKLKGAGAVLIAVAVFATLAVVIRSFFLIIVGAAVVTVVFLHYWNKRPVKTPEEDQVRLNLDK
jgi:fatty acid desaturase